MKFFATTISPPHGTIKPPWRAAIKIYNRVKSFKQLLRLIFKYDLSENEQKMNGCFSTAFTTKFELACLKTGIRLFVEAIFSGQL